MLPHFADKEIGSGIKGGRSACQETVEQGPWERGAPSEAWVRIPAPFHLPAGGPARASLSTLLAPLCSFINVKTDRTTPTSFVVRIKVASGFEVLRSLPDPQEVPSSPEAPRTGFPAPELLGQQEGRGVRSQAGLSV